MTVKTAYTQNQLDLFQRLHFLCDFEQDHVGTMDEVSRSKALGLLSNRVQYNENFDHKHKVLENYVGILVNSGLVDNELNVTDDARKVICDSLEAIPDKDEHRASAYSAWRCVFRPGFSGK